MPKLLPETPSDVLATITELVEGRSGLRFLGGRRVELASKTARAFADSGCPDWPDYLDELARSPSSPLLDHLIRTLTVGETYFFRHQVYFDLLEREIMPRLIAERRERRQLRLWSAGCATGEEAYSLAIMLARLLPDLESWDVSILGTDLNTAFLARARDGRYSGWSLRGSDEAFVAAYFTPDGGRHKIKSRLARLVRFAPLNLADPVYPSPANGTSQLDLIFCRNVLIYFGPELARQVVARLRSALAPDGWLVVGPSDPQPGLLAGFERHGDVDAFAYRRADEPRPAQPSTPPLTEPGRPVLTPSLREARSISHRRPAAPPERASSPAPSRRLAGTGSSPVPAAAPVREPVGSARDWTDLWLAARTATAQGELEAVEAACRQALEGSPHQPEPYYLLGVLCQARSDDDAALAAFRQALYVDRTFVPAILAQATIFRQRGQQQRARRALERASRLLDSRPDDEQILAEEPLTVGRLRDVLTRALLDRSTKQPTERSR
jgi:chemotaxis protein methyltransferase CheR